MHWFMDSLGLSESFENENGEVMPVEKSEKEPKERKKTKYSGKDKTERTSLKEAEKKDYTPSYGSWSKSVAPAATDNRRSRVVNMQGTSMNTYSGVNMVIKQPTEYNGAREIARYLKDGQPVVVNLEKLDKVTAQKVTDFLGGAICALDGKMQKVSNGIIVVTPNNIGITGYVNEDFTASAFAELDI